MGNRWYDAQLGRWISADSIVPGFANPQNLNRYAYVGNNPILYTDPSGHARKKNLSGPGRDDVPPIQVRNLYHGKALVVNEAIYSPGTDGRVSLSEGQEKVGTSIDRIGFGLGVGGAAADLFEMYPGWGGQVVAVVDLGLTTYASLFQGEFYYGRPHPDLPPMWVMSQDMVVTAGELGLGVVTEFLANLLSVPTEGASEAGSFIVDVGTNGASIVYDVGRLSGDFPTQFAIGFYAEDGVVNIYLLNYSPAEEGKTMYLGEIMPKEMLRGLYWTNPLGGLLLEEFVFKEE